MTQTVHIKNYYYNFFNQKMILVTQFPRLKYVVQAENKRENISF